MRQMQLDLDERCQKGSNFPSLRHQEVGHMAHNFFFLDIGLVVDNLYGCICQSIRVFTWANFQVNCNNFFLKTKGVPD